MAHKLNQNPVSLNDFDAAQDLSAVFKSGELVQLNEITDDGELDELALPETRATYALAKFLNIGRSKKSSRYWAMKRCCDLVLAATSIVLLFPVFLVLAIAIKLESSGPVFFIQVRVGERLRLFNIFKFRTMHEGVDSAPTMIFDAESNEFRRLLLENDPRVTKVGRFLRRWSLDELPQILNILKGDMSFVGPRPLSVTESLEIPKAAFIRYSVPPGLTGFAQLANRNSMLNAKRFDYDMKYVQNQSMWVDLKLILKTFMFIKQ